MATGDRIGGARTAGYMRRINTLEDLLIYAISSDEIGSNFGNRIASDDTYVYCDFNSGSGDTIQRMPDDLSSKTTIVSNGSSSGSVKNVVNVDALGDKVWVVDTYNTNDTRIQKFSDSGTLLSDNSITAISGSEFDQYQDIGIFDDGSIAVIKRETRFPATDSREKIILYNSSASGENEIIEIDPNSTTVDDPVGFRTIGINQDQNILVQTEIYKATFNEIVVRVYSSDGSLIETIEDPVSTNSDGYTETYAFLGANRLILNTFSPNALSGVAGFNQVHNISGKLLKVLSGIGSGSELQSTVQGFDNIYTVNNNGIIYRRTYTASSNPQTTWFRYPTKGNDTGKASLGVVDYGLTIPIETSLDGLRPHYFELRDLRDAIEGVAVNYENPATDDVYTISAGVDNIFRVAIDSGQDDWTTATVTHEDRIREDYYNDIELVLDQLEASALA